MKEEQQNSLEKIVKKKKILTVKIVGVTNAQQTLQNLLGWNPIIISISSQNLCNPVNSKCKCN